MNNYPARDASDPNSATPLVRPTDNEHAAGQRAHSVAPHGPSVDNAAKRTGPQASTLKAIALMPPDSYDGAFGSEERAALQDLVGFVAPRLAALESPAPGGVFSEVEALFTGWGSPHLDQSVLAALPALRVVFHAGGSVKSFVSDELWDRGIRITSAAHANAIPVAEFTLAHVILGLKQVLPLAHATREARRFVRRDDSTPSGYGSTVGLLSLGIIGRMVAASLRRLDVRVIAFDPCVSPADAAALGVELHTLEDVFTTANVVSCHSPLLPETTHLLRARHFMGMRPHGTFINTARGAIVRESDLVAALQRRPDLFAVLDVTDPEPPPPESPLYSLPNVLLTPHVAGSVGPECRRMGRMVISEVRRYLAGEPLVGEVTRQQLPTLA